MKSWLVASWFLVLNLESWIWFLMFDLKVLNQSWINHLGFWHHQNCLVHHHEACFYIYWWTSLVWERRIHGDPLVEYWNDLKSAYRKRQIPSYFERELMDKLQRLKQGSMSVEQYRQQMELLFLRVGHRKEERTSIVWFHNGLNMEVRD